MKAKLHELDKIHGIAEAIKKRQELIELKLGKKLEFIHHYSFDEERAMKRHIENMVGAIQLPLGIAGPLRVDGDHAKGEFLIPMATSLKGLVGRVQNGIEVLNEAGGAKVTLVSNSMTRGPALKLGTGKQARAVAEWVSKNLEEIRAEAQSTTRHGKLLWIRPIQVGRTLFLRFGYETGDAMGMNMVTIATDKALRFIEGKTGAEHIALSGNLCIDKKPAAINPVMGRGKLVIAEAVIPQRNLPRPIPELVEASYRNTLLRGAMEGGAYNNSFADVLGAIYVATGQDEAHVVEASNGFTLLEAEGDGLHISVTVPNIQVGAIGGGTGLCSQHEALGIMDCVGDSRKLAEVLASAVLAGEVGWYARG